MVAIDKTKRDPRIPCFGLGRTVATPGALRACDEQGISIRHLLSRHQQGDWGDVGAADWATNDWSVEHAARILSAYRFGPVQLWVITEADRSSTCVLLPHEY